MSVHGFQSRTTLFSGSAMKTTALYAGVCNGYGFGWFMTTLAGEDVAYGRGYGGQALYVIPEREMTVVITSDPTPPSPGGQFQQQLNALVADLLAEE